MLFAALLITSLLTFAQATGLDCFRYVHGGPPAYNPIVQNCRNAIQRIRNEARRDPTRVFDSTGIQAQRLPYTWFNHDCAVMLNTQDYPRPSGRHSLSLMTIADKAESVVNSCLAARGFRIGGETMMDHGVIVSIAGSYPATVATGYLSDGLEGIEPGMGNATERESMAGSASRTLIPVASPGGAAF